MYLLAFAVAVNLLPLFVVMLDLCIFCCPVSDSLWMKSMYKLAIFAGIMFCNLCGSSFICSC